MKLWSKKHNKNPLYGIIYNKTIDITILTTNENIWHYRALNNG